MPPPPDEDPDELVQVNVRIPRWLKNDLDARRATINGGISRDRWAANAFKFALKQPRPGAAVPTAPGMRTAPPPHRR